MKLLFFSFALIYMKFTFSQCKQTTFKLEIKEREYKISNEIPVNLIITNNLKYSLKIPKDMYYGYESDPKSDIVFDVVKRIGQKNVVQKPIANYNCILITLKGKTYINLLKDSSQNYTWDLNSFYQFKKGNYKVRAKFTIPSINEPDSKIVYSNWKDFIIK